MAEDRTIQTVSGAIAKLENSAGTLLESLVVQITPKQSGTGTPSPDNVRQISGWESVSVNVSRADSSDAYEPYIGTSRSIDLGRTVYGGTLDVVSGELTVDRAMVTLDGSSDEVFYTGSSGMPFRTILPDDLKKTTNNRELAGFVSNQMTEVAQASTWGAVGTCSVVTNGTNLYFKLASDLTDISALRTYLASNPLQVVYPLATPQTYQLTPTEISSLVGTNFVWSDAGEVEVTYYTDLIGVFKIFRINGVPIFRPNGFGVKREDVYSAEYTTLTGKIIADRIGWKYSDMSLKWDILTDEMLAFLAGLTGQATFEFTDSDGTHTEQITRKGFSNTPTRTTGPEGTPLWSGIEMDITFLNTHPIDEA